MGNTNPSRSGTTGDLGTVSNDDPWSLLPVGPRRQLAQAAASEFGKRGYHATTTRDIAECVGMSPAGMYVHYASKADLLFTIARVGHQSAFDAMHLSIEGISAPKERVRSMVRAFTRWHAMHHVLARVLQYELRALEPAHYKVIAAIRRKTEQFAADELRQLVPDESRIAMCTIAVLSLGIDTARWYSIGKSPSPEELGECYAELVLRMLRR
ncbi:HTH-type transcriptional repressor KstR2 (plasmid) [Variovorax sp. SRS16]|uniref:TetR/AcrR family transcriptional regulator n=1 Tax=Variovorax sp. SRS16 TaxID=282217 RepID=UPI00131718BF|nr:TetR/AcrR family transcriptional regulator [Variovorax sp. SRS16]VTU46370.1 HTH-type transcriptional repressor KstR2 [Variovorax sp. SRS16]